ncbi:MAG: periplasmic heavy metal sensor [Acidobacteriota bacterium]|nr:MAG: periplasmic heavy metal sensor [Acidobacteriota bacterium]
MTSKILTAVLLILVAGSVAFGQVDTPGNDFVANEADRPERADILRRELQLSQEQLRKIRILNAEMRPRMRDAQQAFRIARRDLDEAIYADELNEEDLRIKMRAVNEAQAEVNRLRAFSEVAVRKILSPEQLVRFRQLRQRFARQGERGVRRTDRPGGMRQMRRDRQPDPPKDPKLP